MAKPAGLRHVTASTLHAEQALPVCTMECQLGDKCHKYASCETSGGTCQLITDPAFETCKSCVQECEAKTDSNPLSALDCEAKC
ncbi:MAG: hypothetical protein M0Q92_01235 [Methanoregula sp.]|nr:hypothetical protein [Methanoregula sp.]